MLEVAAALSAGLGTFGAILAVAVPAPVSADGATTKPWLPRFISRWWAGEASLATRTGWPWLNGRRLVLF